RTKGSVATVARSVGKDRDVSSSRRAVRRQTCATGAAGIRGDAAELRVRKSDVSRLDQRATQPARHRSHGTRAFGALPNGNCRVGGGNRRRRLLARASVIERREMTMKRFVQKTALLVVLAALLSGVPSCSKNSATGKPSTVDYYTCTMHPSVRSQNPKGKCPICGMDLIPVMKKSGSETTTEASSPSEQSKGGEMKQMSGMQGMPGMPGMKEDEMKGGEKSGELVVPVERQQQIGVRYAKVERKPLRHTIRALGLIVPDKTRNWQFVSRVDGYVQKLDVTAPGELVEKDAPLLSIYS